jgi:hypothetical protein
MSERSARTNRFPDLDTVEDFKCVLPRNNHVDVTSSLAVRNFYAADRPRQEVAKA